MLERISSQPIYLLWPLSKEVGKKEANLLDFGVSRGGLGRALRQMLEQFQQCHVEATLAKIHI